MDQSAIANFSFIELFLKADIIVKLVMLGLFAASIWSWSVFIEKITLINKLNRGILLIERSLNDAKSAETIEELSKNGDPSARIINAGLYEVKLATRNDDLSDMGIQMALERMQRIMNAFTNHEVSKAEKGIGVLATIGSSATFIGLFGTVWGIMNAFRSIAINNETNLAIVAPNIAEALFATAMGLFTAIPAVIFYNWISGNIDKYATRIDTLSDDIITRASRRFNEGA